MCRVIRNSLIILALGIILSPLSTLAIPTGERWLRSGAYAQYEFKSIGVRYNDTNLFFGENVSTIFRWECLEVKGTTAKIAITYSAYAANNTLTINSSCYVDIVNRTVSFLNGTSIGETRLWSVTEPKETEMIVIYAMNQATNSARVTASPKFGGYSFTPQGWQEIYSLQGMGITHGVNSIISGIYDRDTGIMLDCHLNADPTLIALGIKDIYRNGRQIFTDTNIDLGPSSIWPEVVKQIPSFGVVALFVAFIILTLAIFTIRKRVKKKHRSHL